MDDHYEKVTGYEVCRVVTDGKSTDWIELLTEDEY